MLFSLQQNALRNIRAQICPRLSGARPPNARIETVFGQLQVAYELRPAEHKRRSSALGRAVQVYEQGFKDVTKTVEYVVHVCYDHEIWMMATSRKLQTDAHGCLLLPPSMGVDLPLVVSGRCVLPCRCRSADAEQTAATSPSSPPNSPHGAPTAICETVAVSLARRLRGADEARPQRSRARRATGPPRS